MMMKALIFENIIFIQSRNVGSTHAKNFFKIKIIFNDLIYLFVNLQNYSPNKTKASKQ